MTAPAPQPQISPEERARLEKENEIAKKKFEDGVREVGRNLRTIQEGFETSIKLSKERRDYAAAQLAQVEPLRAPLAQAASDVPGGDSIYLRVELIWRAFHFLQRMMEIQIELDKKNLQVAEVIKDGQSKSTETPEIWVQLEEQGALKDARFTFPEQSVDYLEARCHMGYSFGMFSWINCIEGIDIVMRATLNEKAFPCQTEEEEADRQKLANALREAMKANPELMKLVGQLGGELQEAWALFTWAGDTLNRLPSVPASSKKQLLEDADWKKLNGKLPLVGGLPQMVKQFPDLAFFFPKVEDVEFPFEILEV